MALRHQTSDILKDIANDLAKKIRAEQGAIVVVGAEAQQERITALKQALAQVVAGDMQALDKADDFLAGRSDHFFY